MRRLPGPADYRLGNGRDSRGSLRVVSGLAENTDSIFCDGSSEPEAAKWMSGSAGCRNHRPRGTDVQRQILIEPATRSPERGPENSCFPLTNDWVENHACHAGFVEGSTR
jgi:hypothetical protein